MNDDNQKYYFVSYTKLINGVALFCNDTTKEHPVKWIMERSKRVRKNFYNLIFYKEITLEEYIIFHPENKELLKPLLNKEICEKCNGRAHPAGEYCQSCNLREYRLKEGK